MNKKMYASMQALSLLPSNARVSKTVNQQFNTKQRRIEIPIIQLSLCGVYIHSHGKKHTHIWVEIFSMDTCTWTSST